jgi:outer membrane protein OmpA-like peptidoglycan-associated protein
MPEPPARPVADSQGAEPSNHDEGLQELRDLLLGDEQKRILALQERLDDLELRSQETSTVVVEAIHLRREQGGEEALRDALGPTVQAALREAVRKDSNALAEALFPVMGPAIRKSVAETIRAMLESFNKTLESSISIQGIKWRLEALRTGRSYAEVVLLHSLVYRVEQVFVIHRKTSLLLLHAVGPDVAAQDADMVTGMLSAIQDFVGDFARDSFHAAPGEPLDRQPLGGDLQVWFEQGPHATLAAVIRGDASQDYRLRLRETLEELHRRFGAELEAFEGDAAPFEPFRPELEQCLVAHYREKERKRPRPYFMVLLLVLVGLLASWQVWRFFQVRKWRAFVEVLRQEPGIVITASGERGGRFQIRGMRDPLSVDPRVLAESAGLEAQYADFQWATFYSLDDAMVLRRARDLLRPPNTAVLGVERGTLRVAGESTPEWAEQLRRRAPLIPGVIALDEHNLNSPDVLLRRRAALESGLILFDTDSWELNADQEPRIAELLTPLRNLIQGAEAAHLELVVELVGHSDSTGTERTNAPLSEARARRVLQELVKDGIDARYLRARGVGAKDPVREEETTSDRQYNRSVTFQVELPQTPK